MSYTDVLLIGTAQGVAIIPGISRSGLTIAISLLLGIKREKAFMFSFLLSIPAITGALGLTFYRQYDLLVLAGIGWIEVFMGIAISMVTGYLALKLLRKIVVRRKFHLFAFYCWTIAAALAALALSGF